jgi:hypothetical protein
MFYENIVLTASPDHFRKATYSPFDCEHSTSELAEPSTVGSVAICKTEEEFSWLTPLKYGTGSGSDRMPAFNELLQNSFNLLSMASGRYRS